MDLPAIDLTGPWTAVALDESGYVINLNDPEEPDLEECRQIGVVRRTANPVPDGPPYDGYAQPDKMPSQYTRADVLFMTGYVDDDPDDAPRLYAQAIAIAAALNTAHPTGV